MLALVSIDDLRLVIPQNQILTLEPVEDLKAQTDHNQASGLIVTDEGSLPAYNLNNSLEVAEFKSDRRIVIVLSNLPNNYAILADELNILEADLVRWKSLPRAIHSEQSPVIQVAVIEGKLVCQTNAEMLYKNVISASEQNSDKAA